MPSCPPDPSVSPGHEATHRGSGTQSSWWCVISVPLPILDSNRGMQSASWRLRHGRQGRGRAGWHHRQQMYAQLQQQREATAPIPARPRPSNTVPAGPAGSRVPLTEVAAKWLCLGRFSLSGSAGCPAPRWRRRGTKHCCLRRQLVAAAIRRLRDIAPAIRAMRRTLSKRTRRISGIPHPQAPGRAAMCHRHRFWRSAWPLLQPLSTVRNRRLCQLEGRGQRCQQRRVMLMKKTTGNEHDEKRRLDFMAASPDMERRAASRRKTCSQARNPLTPIVMRMKACSSLDAPSARQGLRGRGAGRGRPGVDSQHAAVAEARSPSTKGTGRLVMVPRVAGAGGGERVAANLGQGGQEGASCQPPVTSPAVSEQRSELVDRAESVFCSTGAHHLLSAKSSAVAGESISARAGLSGGGPWQALAPRARSHPPMRNRSRKLGNPVPAQARPAGALNRFRAAARALR